MNLSYRFIHCDKSIRCHISILNDPVITPIGVVWLKDGHFGSRSSSKDIKLTPVLIENVKLCLSIL